MPYTLYLTPLTFTFQHMKIEHLAVWTNQLDVLKAFYIKFFNAIPNEKYHNPGKQFSSYFLSFGDGARLELMQMPGIPNSSNDLMRQNTGLIHFAMSAGSKEKVDSLTEAIRQEGFTVMGEPRWTGDGYYESVILDPDNNRIEITI
ncbi:MAG TPA: VOC family protein [Chitinophagaceae bacterium]|nr:VOC family protein [Chitinophagaceae bacterium]